MADLPTVGQAHDDALVDDAAARPVGHDAEALLARARRAKVIATATEDGDVLKMIGAIAWAAQGSPDSAAQAERLLALLIDGLRQRGAADGQ